MSNRRMPNRHWRTRFAFVSVLTLTTLTGSTGIASADDDATRPAPNPEERAAALIRPAIVYIGITNAGVVRNPKGILLAERKEFSSLATCTGFVVNPEGWIATAGHCVDGGREDILMEAMPEIMKYNQGADPQKVWNWVRTEWTVEGSAAGTPPAQEILLVGAGIEKPLPANVSEFRPLDKGDYTLLKVQKGNLPSSELASDSDVTIGTSVLSVGFPGSTENVTDPTLDPTNKSGKVSKKSTSETVPFYETDAALSPGMSGGPTINLDGKVIGLNSFRPAKESQAFNFIAPSAGLTEMMGGKGVKPELGSTDVIYRKGLENLYSGHYSDAISNFDEVTSLSPDYPGVPDLKTKAVADRTKYGDVEGASGSNMKWYGLGALVVVAIAAAAAFMVLRSRRTATSPAGGSPGTGPTPGGGPTWQPQGYVPPNSVQPNPVQPQPFTAPTSPVIATGDAPAQATAPPGPAPTKDIADDHPTVQREQAVGEQPNEPHFCANCGFEHHPNEKFCPSCGHRMV